MADHESLQEIDYESLGGGSLTSNLVAGAFAGIMVGRNQKEKKKKKKLTLQDISYRQKTNDVLSFSVF